MLWGITSSSFVGERVLAARIGRGAGVGDSVSFVLCGNNMAVPSAPIRTPKPSATTTRNGLFLGGCLEITTSGMVPYIVSVVVNV